MNIFYGYPIPDDAHPERPWWRRYGGGHGSIPELWKRGDGAWCADLVAYDLTHPLPAPPPLCGQVWRWADGSSGMIFGVNPSRPPGDWTCHVRWNDNWSDQTIWPPPGAVLVAGPGSPWAPADYEPPKENR